jgi:heme/copper-type cytochrome/quinol oxidase subunit 2
MRVAILSLCVLLAAGVFTAMFVSIWSTRRSGACQSALRQSLTTEVVWAAIPCLMIVAAAIPAVVAIFTTHAK